MRRIPDDAVLVALESRPSALIIKLGQRVHVLSTRRCKCLQSFIIVVFLVIGRYKSRAYRIALFAFC